MLNEKLHYVVVTAIIKKDDKYLIAQRSPEEKAFPEMWTVPGGKLAQRDYIHEPKDTSDSWYNVVGTLLRREVREEVGLEVSNIRYLLDLIYMRSDGYPTLILSFYCDWESGNVVLEDSLVDYEWVSIEDIKRYELVPGLLEEIEIADRCWDNTAKECWTGKHDDPEQNACRDG